MTLTRTDTATRVADALLALEPELWKQFGAAGSVRCKEDVAYHLSFLAEAWLADDITLFSAYAHWAAVVLEARKIPRKNLIASLRIIQTVLSEEATPAEREKLHLYVESAVLALADVSVRQSFIEGDRTIDGIARAYLAALLRADRNGAQDIIFNAIAAGTDVRAVYLQVFEPVQYEIGRLWQMNRLSVAQEHYCTAATQFIIAQLFDKFGNAPAKRQTIVAICVSGELHDIGLRIVCDFLEMEGWDTIVCGAGTSTAELLEVLAEKHAPVLAISATMTFHLSRVGEIIDAIKQNGLGVKVIVGGSPFRASPLLWQHCGADAFADDAASASAAITRLVAET